MWDFASFGDNLALLADNGERLTYRELAEQSDKLAAAVGGRCLAFIMCSNTVGSVLGYASFMEHHIVPLLLNAHMDAELLAHLLDTYRPRFVWAPSKEPLAPYADFAPVYDAYGYSLWANPDSGEAPLYEELALLLTTSGSTGSQKFVRQSYTNVETNTRQIAQYLELTAAERPVTTLPMNYTYGCSVINSHLYVGATLLLTDKAVLMGDFWEFVTEQKATSIAGVPYTYEMLDRLRFLERMELPDLVTMTQAGGKLPPELQMKFATLAAQQGKRFIVMYGACEATARMGYLPADKAIDKYGSCGIAIPEGRFMLRDATGQIIEEPEVTGELVYQGANVTLGYAEAPEDLIKGDERHGILETGDMAKRDVDGFYYIVGRKKRFLKVYGNRVNLDEMERMLKTAFEGLECAVAGIDDHVMVFVTEAHVALGEDIRKFLVEKTKLNPKAFAVREIPEIPKNDAGKLQYKELEIYY